MTRTETKKKSSSTNTIIDRINRDTRLTDDTIEAGTGT